MSQNFVYRPPTIYHFHRPAVNFTYIVPELSRVLKKSQQWTGESSRSRSLEKSSFIRPNRINQK